MRRTVDTEGAGLTVREAHDGPARSMQRRRAWLHLAREDAVLARLAASYPETDPFEWGDHGPRGHDLFRTLAFLIVGQAVTPSVAAEQYDVLNGLVGGELTPGSIAGVGVADVERAGVARFKAVAIGALAQAVNSDRVSLEALDELPDEQICQVLTLLPGVGRWAVELFLIRGYHRPDVFPASDPVLRHAIRRQWAMASLPTPGAADALAAGWRPHRSFAAALLWATHSHQEGWILTDSGP
ncbi:DNA-3-methyladenine glycosylase family protein [Nocardioides sp. HB32]